MEVMVSDLSGPRNWNTKPGEPQREGNVAERDLPVGKRTLDMSWGASSNGDSSGCHSRSYEAAWSEQQVSIKIR